VLNSITSHQSAVRHQTIDTAHSSALFDRCRLLYIDGSSIAAHCVWHDSTLAFTVIFSTFLMVFVNWSALLSCDGEASCKAVVGIRPDAYKSPTFGEVIVVGYHAIISLLY
jgi:hypothetical protein